MVMEVHARRILASVYLKIYGKKQLARKRIERLSSAKKADIQFYEGDAVRSLSLHISRAVSHFYLPQHPDKSRHSILRVEPYIVVHQISNAYYCLNNRWCPPRRTAQTQTLTSHRQIARTVSDPE